MKRLPLFLLFFFGGFVLLHLFNLDRIPLVWFDEVMGLDPAVNAIFKEGFVSSIWPQQGTEERFMAYLPVRFLFHMTHLKLLPFEVFWQRLPWALYFFGSAILLYKTVRREVSAIWLPLLVVFVFINDKTVFEVARSMRVDPLSLLFLSGTGYAYYSNRKLAQAVLSVLLVFIHPNLWMIALLAFGEASFTYNRRRNKVKLAPNMLWAIPIVAILAYGFSIAWDVQGFVNQLGEHGSHHDASGGVTGRLYDHLIGRFWPYYSSQPWMPFLVYGALVYSIYQIIKRQGNLWSLALIATHGYWMIALAPFYRYNAVLLLLSLLSLISALKQLKWNANWAWASALMLLILPIGTLCRHALAIADRKGRDPKPVVEWLQQELSGQNCLIMGHDIAYYAVALDTAKDYSMYNLQPSKFKFGDYDAAYVLFDNYPDGYTEYLMGNSIQYKPDWKESQWQRFIKSKANKPNYERLWLMQVPSEEAWIKLSQAMDEGKL